MLINDEKKLVKKTISKIAKLFFYKEKNEDLIIGLLKSLNKLESSISFMNIRWLGLNNKFTVLKWNVWKCRYFHPNSPLLSKEKMQPPLLLLWWQPNRNS